jgi:hypothetical protein
MLSDNTGEGGIHRLHGRNSGAPAAAYPKPLAAIRPGLSQKQLGWIRAAPLPHASKGIQRIGIEAVAQPYRCAVHTLMAACSNCLPTNTFAVNDAMRISVRR